MSKQALDLLEEISTNIKKELQECLDRDILARLEILMEAAPKKTKPVHYIIPKEEHLAKISWDSLEDELTLQLEGAYIPPEGCTVHNITADEQDIVSNKYILEHAQRIRTGILR